MKQTVTVGFCGFWPTFDEHNNVFVEALRTSRDVVVIDTHHCNDEPDLLFFSNRDNRNIHRRFKRSIRIYFSGENDVPDMNDCDYALSMCNMSLNGRHLRYPLYMLYEYDDILVPVSMDRRDKMLSRGFCSAVVKNTTSSDPRRLEIIDRINALKPVAFGGAYRNNIGKCVADKIDFIKNFKFNLAIENSKVEGYVTEKIVEAFSAATIPIYWGDKAVTTDFNPAAFINAADYDTLDSLANAVEKIDNDDKAYMAMLTAPKITTATPDFNSQLEEFLSAIADNQQPRRSRYGYQLTLTERLRITGHMTGSRLAMAIARRALKK